jgi:hypothetical protein
VTAAGNQRWRAGRSSARPPGEPIRPAEYDVLPIADDATARAFVLAHHYSGSYPAARRRYGLYRRGLLAGVAVFSVPCNARTFACLPCPPALAVELGRFVLLDEVPGNGETWFLARCFERLRRDGFAAAVSFSDPMPRTAEDGSAVFPGHFGTIYQAHNGRYVGRSRPRTLRLLPDGRAFSDRAAQKVRAREQGWRYAAGLLERFGADAPREDAAAWLNHWLRRLTRAVRHPGNFKYAWALDRRLRRGLPPALPYPKRDHREHPD